MPSPESPVVPTIQPPIQPTIEPTIELSVTTERAKARVLELLAAHGLVATSGSVRLAYPFTVEVQGVTDGAAVRELVARVDPGAGLIETARRVA